MIPRAIALYANTDRAHAAEIAVRVAALARKAGLGVAVCAAPDAAGPAPVVPTCDFEAAHLLVTVGGDGTLLRGARIAHPAAMPILGVNTGRLGFLTEVEADESGFADLARAFREGFTAEPRVALHARVDGSDATHFALNDVVVRRGAQARLAPFGLSLDGETIAHLPSDGVIVSTPTGSTAYALSAGGPIVHPRVDALGVSALLPHTLFARPIVVPSTAEITITCDGEITQANLETDGLVVTELHAGDRIIVRRAPEPVIFARVRSGTFFARLETKLQWGVPIKGF